ncbi:hypothetical protein GCM10009826_08090 [Humibacillus xanthopallidus]
MLPPAAADVGWRGGGASCNLSLAPGVEGMTGHEARATAVTTRDFVGARQHELGRGRDAAFTAFVDASWSRLHRHGYVLTGSSVEAEELVQETLVKVYQAWHRIAPDGAPLAYTRTAMARSHVSRWRSLTRRSAVEDRVVLDRTLAAGHPAWE